MEFQKTSEGFSFHQGKDNEKDIKYPNYQKGFFFLLFSLFPCLFATCLFVLLIKAAFAAYYFLAVLCC